jgi:hypothetical protein
MKKDAERMYPNAVAQETPVMSTSAANRGRGRPKKAAAVVHEAQ